MFHFFALILSKKVFPFLGLSKKYSLKNIQKLQIIYLTLSICTFSLFASGQIIGTEKLFGKYRQFVWQDPHGLPQNGISTIVQTPDGYLWLAIAEGVVRFDGVNFTAFDTGNTPEIKSNNVQSLFVTRNGTLWIGTHGGGLTSYFNGQFKNYSTADGLSDSHIKSLFEDSQGNLWIGTDGGGLNSFREGKFKVYQEWEGLPDNFVRAITEDSQGNLWIGTNGGLAKLKNNKFETYETADGLAGDDVGALLFDSTKRLWIGGAGGLSFLTEDGKFQIFNTNNQLDFSEIRSLAEDRFGTIFVGTTENGLYRLNNGHFEVCNTEKGLISNEIQSIFPAPNGDLWLGTNGGGLAQLHLGSFEVLTISDGLASDMVSAVFTDKSGGIWVGTEEGLSRFKDGELKTVKMPDGKAFRGVSQIAQDNQGKFWISSNNRETSARVFSFDETSSTVKLIPNDFFQNSSVVLPSKNGDMWFGSGYNGLYLLKNDGQLAYFGKADGLADEYITSLFEDSQGSIWIGTRNGLSRFKDDKLTTFNAEFGFHGKHILSFYEDSRGSLWIGTHGDGLFRFYEEKFDFITVKNGLYDNLAFQILEDAKGNLWMSGNKGIYRAGISEIEDFFAGRLAKISSFSYGSSDGMLSRECNGANPAGAKSPDGRLWFPTIKGVVVVSPEKISLTPSQLQIESVTIDGQSSSFSEMIEIKPSQKNLEIKFSAISWNRPSQVRFKYQMEGLSGDWIDAETRRTAYYQNISPGQYTFRVIADNGEGVWNMTGKSLSIRVFPAFYQTWWFLLLCLLLGILIIRLIYLYRVRQLEKINDVRTAFTRQLIEYQEKERQRVAVELHDSIGQSLIVIRNRALMSLSTPEKHEKMLAQMEEISESAADSISEIRQIAHNLHPYQLEHLGLKTALESMIEQASETSKIDFSSRIDDINNVLSKENEINFYRIVQESLNNILKHSQAQKVEVKILRNNGNLNLLIRDDGKGFAEGQAKTKKTGLGLAGISERAKMMNAEYKISSMEGKGTTVSLTLNL